MGHQPARPHPGWRGQPAYIDAAHQVRARVEDCVRTGKDTGISKLPSHQFALNQAWLAAALTAATLLAWLRHLALDGDLAKAEPKKLCYRLLHIAARLARSGRRRRLKISATWPWATAIETAVLEEKLGEGRWAWNPAAFTFGAMLEPAVVPA